MLYRRSAVCLEYVVEDIAEDDLYSDGYCGRWALSSVQHRDCHIQISCEGEPDEVRQEVIACESVDGRESMVCAKDDIDERDKDGECEPVRLVRKKYERPDEVDGELEYIISNGDTAAINAVSFFLCARIMRYEAMPIRKNSTVQTIGNMRSGG